MAIPYPILLIDILTAVPQYISSKNIPVGGVEYRRRLKSPVKISKCLTAARNSQTPSDITIEIANLKGFLTQLNATCDLVGTGIKIRSYDVRTQAVLSEYRGHISAKTLGDVGTITASVNELLKVTLPIRTLTNDDFPIDRPNVDYRPSADLGKPFSIPFGRCQKVHALYVYGDLVANTYDYILGYGVIKSNNSNKATTVVGYRSTGNDDRAIIDQSEYTVFDGSQVAPYAGFAFVRFTVEQMTFTQDSFYDIEFSFYGLTMGGTDESRNFITNIQNLLSNTTWGLSQTVNSTAFDAAKTMQIGTHGASPVLMSDLKCDGAITTQQAAIDILTSLQGVARCDIKQNVDTGAWEPIIDTYNGTVAATFGHRDGYWKNIIKLGTLQYEVAANRLKTLTIKYGYSPWTSEYVYQSDIRDIFPSGIDDILENPFIYDHTTADIHTCYLAKKALVADEQLQITVGKEGNALNEGSTVNIIIPRASYNLNSNYRVVQTDKSTMEQQFDLLLEKHTSDIYEYTPGTLPSDAIDPVVNPIGTPSDPINLAVDSWSLDVTPEGNNLSSAVLKADQADATYTSSMKFGWKRHNKTVWTFVDGALISGVTWKTTIQGLIPGLSYDFCVKALNIYGDESSLVTLLNQIVPGDTTAPGVPTGLTCAATIWTITAKVTAQTEADLGGYEFHASKTSGFTPSSATLKQKGNSNSCTFLGDANAQDWWVTVRAYDISNPANYSAYCTQVKVTTETKSGADVVAPATPTGLNLTTGISKAADGSDYAWIRATWTANSETDMNSYEWRIKETGGNYVYGLVGTNSQQFSPVRSNVLHYVGVRAIDNSGNKSAFCSDQSITSAKDTTPPGPVTSPSATAAFKTIFLTWVNPSDNDIAYIEIFSGATNVRANATSLSKPQGTFYADPIGTYGTTRYYWFKVWDTSGNPSATEAGPVSATTATVAPADIATFAVTASKIFTKVPIPDGDSWTDNSPSAGYVTWNAHTLYYNGVGYSISSGNTNKKYIYWLNGGTSYTTSDTNPTLGDSDFLMATNTSGAHDLAWNALANAVIGSAYIQDLAVLNAKIADLAVDNAKIANVDAVKLTGDIVTARMQLNVGNAVNGGSVLINPGRVLIKGSNSLLSWQYGGDSTDMDGGMLHANTVSANKLVIGSRGITFQGLEISCNYPVNNTLYWSAGVISYMKNQASDSPNVGYNTADISIASGSQLVAAGTTMYLYWVKDAGVLSVTTTRETAFGSLNVLIATYRVASPAPAGGSTDLVVTYGRTIVDGSDIVAETITAANLIKTQALITAAAQIQDALIVGQKLSIGLGINIVNPRYCDFEEATLPALHVGGGTVTQDVSAYFGLHSLKLTATANPAWCVLSANWSTDRNITLPPFKKLIVSFYVKSDAASKDGHLFLSTAAGDFGIPFTTSPTPTQWTRIYGVLDLTLCASTSANIRIDHTYVGGSMWFDGFMLEEAIGGGNTPSAFSLPGQTVISGSQITTPGLNAGYISAGVIVVGDGTIVNSSYGGTRLGVRDGKTYFYDGSGNVICEIGDSTYAVQRIVNLNKSFGLYIDSAKGGIQVLSQGQNSALDISSLTDDASATGVKISSPANTPAIYLSNSTDNSLMALRVATVSGTRRLQGNRLAGAGWQTIW